MSMPQSSMMGYYFPWKNALRTYDTSSYNPIFSDNVVSSQDIQVLLADLQTQPLYSPVYCDPWLYGICVLLLVMIAGQVIFITSATRGIGKNFFVIPLIFFGFIIGMSVIMCKVKSNAQKRLAKRKAQLNVVLARHQQTTFGGKNVDLWMSVLGSYLGIEFAFRMNRAGAMQMGQAPGMPMNPFGQPAYPQPGFPQPGPQFGYQQPQPYYAGSQVQPSAGQQPQPYKVSAPVF